MTSSSALLLYVDRQYLSPYAMSAFVALHEKGIGVQVHHIPVYLTPYYARLGYRPGLCPVAERFVASEISLPLYPDLSVSDQVFVVRTLKSILNTLV